MCHIKASRLAPFLSLTSSVLGPGTEAGYLVPEAKRGNGHYGPSYATEAVGAGSIRPRRATMNEEQVLAPSLSPTSSVRAASCGATAPPAPLSLASGAG